VPQLLLELVKATMRVHMVLLEVMVARERVLQGEEPRPALNALQKVGEAYGRVGGEGQVAPWLPDTSCHMVSCLVHPNRSHPVVV
jgi:hypothetical protein